MKRLRNIHPGEDATAVSFAAAIAWRSCSAALDDMLRHLGKIEAWQRRLVEAVAHVSTRATDSDLWEICCCLCPKVHAGPGFPSQACCQDDRKADTDPREWCSERCGGCGCRHGREATKTPFRDCGCLSAAVQRIAGVVRHDGTKNIRVPRRKAIDAHAAHGFADDGDFGRKDGDLKVRDAA